MNRSRSGASTSVASGAAALLQKARGQSRGQLTSSAGRSNAHGSAQVQRQGGAGKTGDDEEDDIANYLSQLSKKTSGIKKKQFQDDDISSGLSDLSLSDEKGTGVKQGSVGSSPSVNKFLKKSSTSIIQESKSATSTPTKKEASARPSSAVVQRSPSKFTSSALQKASKLSAKITARKKGAPPPQDSDSSDQDVGRPSVDGMGRFNGSGAGATLPFDDGAPAVGDGNRFLKKTPSKGPPPPQRSESPASSIEEESEDNFQGRGKAGGNLGGFNGMPMTSTPLKHGDGKGAKKGSIYNRIMAHLDTDEEDMEDLIGGVSSPEPMASTAKKKQAEPKRVMTPYKRPEPVSESEDSSVSLPAPAKSKDHAVKQHMTVEDLEPVALDLSSAHSVQSRADESSIAEDVSLGPTLAGLQTIDDLLPKDSPSPRGLLHGLQTIDDLLPAGSPTPTPRGRVIDTPTYGDDFESISERTVSPMPVRSPSPKPVLVEETDSSHSSILSVREVSEHDRSRTVSESHSELSTHSSRSRTSRSYSRSSQSYSRSSRSRGSARRHRHSADDSDRTSRSYSTSRSRSPGTDRSVASKASTRSEGSAAYSEDFHTVSHSTNEDTFTDDKTVTSDFSTSHSRSDARRASRRRHAHSRGRHHKDSSRKGGQDAAVQTSSSLHSMDHHWVKDMNFQTPGYFKLLSANIHEHMSHSVDPMLLQTLSSFDPTSLDLHASLAQQVRQTRLAVTNTLRQHSAFLESLEENFTYTTLENTKLFIKRQKKRRRKDAEREAALQELDINADI